MTYSGFRWREVHGNDCNACPARLLVYLVRSGTAISGLYSHRLLGCHFQRHHAIVYMYYIFLAAWVSHYGQ